MILIQSLVRSIHNEIKKACDYTKIPFHSMSINTWNGELKIAPTTRVFVVYDTKKLEQCFNTCIVRFCVKWRNFIHTFCQVKIKEWLIY
jgi:hypothetical protein